MNNSEGCFDKFFGGVILGTMFIVVIVLVAVSIVAAYGEILYTNIVIRDTLTNMNKYIQTTQIKNISFERLNEFRSQLVLSTQRGLDLSSIRFLYQLLSAALISAGVYLLSRSYRNMKKAEKRAEKAAKKARLIGPFAANLPVSTTILTHIIFAHQNSSILRTSNNENLRRNLLPQTRDAIILFYRKINEAAEQKNGIDRFHFDPMMDKIPRIRENLVYLMNRDGIDLNEQISLCNFSIELLQNDEFVERFEKQLEELED